MSVELIYVSTTLSAWHAVLSIWTLCSYVICNISITHLLEVRSFIQQLLHVFRGQLHNQYHHIFSKDELIQTTKCSHES